MNAEKKLRKILDKLVHEPGVTGYYIDGDKVVILVEDDDAYSVMSSLSFANYKTEVRKIGRIRAL
jgi:hypothetical protein